MKTPASRRLFTSTSLLAAASLSTIPPAFAGIMGNNIPVQTYRDFAENRGIFSPTAQNVTIYDVNGNEVGVIERMMSFDSVVDGGYAALTGGAQFLSSVAHNGGYSNVTFTGRFGATSGTPFYDVYHVIKKNNAWGDATNYNNDYQVARLNKIVTEAEAVPYMTDTALLNNLVNVTVLRVGGGTQTIATGNGTETTIAGGYAYLTGGTIKFTSETVRLPTGSTLPPGPYPTGVSYTVQTSSNPGSEYNAYSFIYYNREPDADTPLDIGIRSGDSGSASWAYNPNTERWEYVGAAQSGGGGGYGALNQMRSGNEWSVAVIESYDSPAINASGGGNIVWNTAAPDGSGTLVQGATAWDYIGLAPGVHGATSTTSANGSSTAASDAQMDATRNLILAGDGGTLVLAGSIDMGAGMLTFDADYTLTNGGDNTRRLNSAGFVVNAGVTVTTQLTGATGDEWRKIGDGTLIISGSGANLADLNVGGGGLVLLDRSGGAAARNVKINGGGVTVRLIGSNQISGDIVFGHRGGTLDVYGHDLTLGEIIHLDVGARIANTAANTTSTFTFTGSGEQTYLGQFADGGSLANGELHVVYDPTTPAGAVWTLNGTHANSGGYDIEGGELRLQGFNTLHAGGYIDPNDWTRAVMVTGDINVASGTRFTLGREADLAGNLNLASGATFKAEIDDGISTFTGALSGAGTAEKTGRGTLHLSVSGGLSAGTLSDGVVFANSAAELGSTVWTINDTAVLTAVDASASALLARTHTDSTGVIALARSIGAPGNPDNNPVLTGYNDLFLGALGLVEVGTAGTTNTLTAWAGTFGTGWNLGGAGGELVVNLKLSGSGQLAVGNGVNPGIVTLTNARNAELDGFSGAIVINPGAILRHTDADALGNTSGVLVQYGAHFGLGPSPNAALARIDSASTGVVQISGTDSNNYNFAALGLDGVALGADGIATYSGTLTPGASGYRFGGAGLLTVASNLGGTHNLTLDGQGFASGVTTLSGNNTFTGTITVQGGTLFGLTGTHVLRVGSGTALGSDNTLQLLAGGILDINGTSVGVGNVSGEPGSAILNAGGTAGTLTINQTGTGILASTLASPGAALNIVKTGSGTLVLTGTNSQTGTLTVSGGAVQVGNDGDTGTLGAATVALGSGTSLILARSNSATFANVISGSGSLIKQSAGTVTLSGNSTYTGGTIVETGTLGVAHVNALGTGVTTLHDGTTLSVSANNFAGTVQVTSGNEATLNISNGNTFAGTLLGSGTVRFGGSSYSENRTVSTVNNSAFTGTFIAQRGTVSLSGANANWSGTSLQVIGVNSDNLSILQVTGAGTTRINSVTALYGAQLLVGGSTTLDIVSGEITRGLTSYGSSITGIAAGAQLTSSGGTLTFDTSGGNMTVGNANLAIVDSGGTAVSVVKNGTGTLTLAGSNTYTDGTVVQQGTLGVAHVNALGTGIATLHDGTTLSVSANNFAGALQVTSGNEANLNISNGNTFAGTLLGSGIVRFGGSSYTENRTVSTVNNSAFTGTFITQRGTVSLAGANADWSGTAFQTIGTNSDNLSILRVTGTGTTRINSVTALYGAQLLVGGSTTLDVVSGGITRSATTAGSSITGIAAGAQLTSSGGTLAFDTSGGNMTVGNANLAIVDSGSTAVSVVKNGAGTLTLPGSNTHTGGTTLNAGDLVINQGTALGTGTFTVNTTATGNILTVANNDAVSLANAVALPAPGAATQLFIVKNAASASTGTTLDLAGVISGGSANATLAFNTNRAGDNTTVFQLSGNNTFQGTIQVARGSLAVAHTGALGNASNTVSLATTDNAALGSLRFLVGGTFAQNLDLVGATKTLNTDANNVSLSGVVSGSAVLRKIGSGTLTLTGSNTYSGGTVVQAGTLALTNLNAAGTGVITLGDTTALTSSVSNFAGAVRVDTGNSATYTVNNGQTFAGTFLGGGTLTFYGNSYTQNRYLSAVNNSAFTGTLAAGRGTVHLTGANADWSGTSLQVTGTDNDNWSRFRVTGAGTTRIKAVTALYGAYLYAGGSTTLDIVSGEITRGATNAGSYIAGLASGAKLTSSGGTLTVNTSGAGMQIGDANLSIVNAGGTAVSLVKNGAGTLTLAGNNTYTGGTTVNAGTLTATHNSALGTGAVTVGGTGTLTAGTGLTLDNAINVNAGGTLAGTATYAGAVTLASGATISPGNSPGILTLDAGGSFAGGSIYRWELQGASPGTAGTDFDQLVISGGTLTVASGAVLQIVGLSVNYANSFWSSDHTFIVALADGGNISGVFDTLDTSNAGSFSAYGTWSLGTAGGNLVAEWQAGSLLMAPGGSPVPEPGTYALLGGITLAGLLAWRRRQHKR